MQCSLAAYDKDYVPEIVDTEFSATEYMKTTEASLAKTVYTSIITSDKISKPVFIFAIRGSASFLDHMVNLNGSTQNAEDFIVRSNTG